jgi:uncharacterized protein YdeI (YjbR/CyaY-like superfamily)
MNHPNSIHFENRDAWRRWLEKNHGKASEIWLIYYKKHTGKPTVQYGEAVEEALCFGWIDSTVRTLDDERYMQKYTPRNKTSRWSDLNRKRAEKMIKAGKMTDAGMVKIDEAKKSGRWDQAYSSQRQFEMPPELKEALKKNKIAWDNFNNFAPSYRTMYMGWVASAKKPETRAKRVREVVERSARNEKPGMM